MKKLMCFLCVSTLMLASVETPKFVPVSKPVATTGTTIYNPNLPQFSFAPEALPEPMVQPEFASAKSVNPEIRVCGADWYMWLNYFLGLGNALWLALYLADQITGNCGNSL